IVLNACYSATQAEGLAAVIDCVVGIEDAISDEAARQFATAFYRGLGYERSIGEAFALGKNQIELAGLGEAGALHLLNRTEAAGSFAFTNRATPQPTISRGTMKQPSLTMQQKMQLVEALLACASVANRQTRESIINDLPGALKSNIRRSDVDRVDVGNLVTAAANYATGLTDLLTVVRFYEGDSLGVQGVEALLSAQ
ncbi:MAG: hypothetical protein KDE31_27760, partial [Caldilineaceae bacterium]|nr:hypothetical protein [Caldilineaceae bacterium]